VEDPQRDLITPALEGTRNVMNSVACVGKRVRRVVVTSSVAAIRSKEPGPDGVWTEECWNDWATLDDNPYSKHPDPDRLHQQQF
jgi:nucleoside-diphosphate-sugar epimerase